MRLVQTLALVIVAAAAVPLTLNQCSELDTRRVARTEAASLAQLGKAATEAKDPQLAVEAYSQAVGLDRLNAGYRDEALRATVELIVNDASFITGGNALRLQTELAQALTSARGDEVRTLLAFGRLLQYRGKPVEARDRFKEAVAKEPKSADAHLLLGDALLKEGDLDGAAASLAKSLELEDRPITQFAMGQVRVRQERWDDAVPHLSKAAEQLKNGNVYFALGKVQWHRKRWKECSDALEKALALDASLVKAHAMLGDAWNEQGRALLAMGAFQLAFQRAQDLESYRKLGRAQSQLQMNEAALKTWNEIRELSPDDPEPHCRLGAVGEGLGDYEMAVGAYRKCITTAGPNKDYAQMVEGANKRVQQIEAALSKARDAEKK